MNEERFTSIMTGVKAGLLFMGTIIGAGFASGKEILIFFAGNAVSLVFAVIFAGIFFYLTGLLFFNLGKRIQGGNLFKITEVLLKKYSSVFNLFLLFSYLILLAAMLAGADALAGESLGYKSSIPVFSIIMLILSINIIRRGIKGLLKINSILVPAVVMFIFAVCIFSLSNTNPSDSGNWSELGMGFFASIYNAILYVALNMLLSSAILISAGKNMTKPQIKTACITAAIIISILLTLVLLACRFNYSEIHGMEMPTVILSLKISPYFGFVTVVILSCAIFTTLISSMYPLKEYLEEYIPNERKLYLIIAVSGFLLSRIGFSYIIQYIYPIQGIIGIAFIAFCTVYDAQQTKLKFPVKFKKIKQAK